MATTSYASVIYYFLHVASQRFNEAKYFIISHITCRYTCIKIHSSFSFIAVLFVPRLSEHERPGAIGMLKAGVCVSDVTWYYNCIPSTVQCLRDLYQATGTVKYQMQVWLTKMMTRRKTATYVECFDDIYIDDIRFTWLPSVPAQNLGSECNLYPDF